MNEDILRRDPIGIAGGYFIDGYGDSGTFSRKRSFVRNKHRASHNSCGKYSRRAFGYWSGNIYIDAAWKRKQKGMQ